MDTIKPDKYDLKKFGASLGTVFLVVTFFISRKSPQNIWPTLLLSLAFYVSALIKPSLLKPFHAFFMKVGSVMTWIITRFFLLIIFYFLFTPMGLIIKLLRIDFLDRKIDRRKESYWKEKEKDTLGKLGYEKQF
jgi:formate-dependent nitrite reductase membrane component NrfD